MTQSESYTHQDQLAFLQDRISLKEKLLATHETIKKQAPFIARVSLALYDPKTAILKTYIHSSGDDNPLENYQTPIDNAPSLKRIMEQGCPRVVNNIEIDEKSDKRHHKNIKKQGYAASYTIPMFHEGNFFGFLFFNSYEKEVFNESVLQHLDLYGHIITLILVNEIKTVQTLTAAIKTTGHITHHRDPETGSHLDRMSRYSRLIAETLATRYQLDDSYIENIFMYSPLHDIGKIAIPDHILLKPGKLTEDEMTIMKTHSIKGKEIIDDLLFNFGLDKLDNADILRNIAAYHHESINGKGYPLGMQGDEIPLEARIVAVADVFDALTSRRSYKEAWSNDEAFAHLEKMAGEQLDSDCVAALVANLPTILQIQQQFSENPLG